MKILLILSLLVVARAACETLSGVNIDTGAVTQNSVTPSEYSRVNTDAYKNYESPVHPVVYKTPRYSPTPAPRVSTTALPTYSTPRAIIAEAYRKPVTIKPTPATPYKTTPVIRTANEDSAPGAFKTETYTIPRSVIQTYTISEDGKALNENERPDSYTTDYADIIPESDDYQPKEYAAVSIDSPYLTPVAVYKQYTSVPRRGYRIPVYRRPSYGRLLNVASPAYRALAYSRPVAYSVPTARRLAYAYGGSRGGFTSPRAIRYVYDSPRLALSGLAAEDYDDYVEGDYDEFIKKK